MNLTIFVLIILLVLVLSETIGLWFEGYITVSPVDLRDRPALPPDYADYWHKYQHFYSDVTAGLSFVCFSRFRPA
ncbi:hypothetical protein AGMMS49928_27590 [Spirochaetia bacterium]|nr:hypothetical protein AGMMS49928_27590 [Spirochaetia bacterium]